VLVLQGTNAGVRRPGYEANCKVDARVEVYHGPGVQVHFQLVN